MTIFVLPDLGEGLPDAEIRQWHLKVGDPIKADCPLVSMETAKAIVDVPSPYTGVIKTLFGKEGDIIKTGQPLVEFSNVEGKVDSGTVAGQLEVHQDEIILSPKVAAHDKNLHHDHSHARSTVMRSEQKIESTVLDATWEPLKGIRRTMAMAMTLSGQEIVPVTVHDDADVSAWTAATDISVRIIRAIVHAAGEEPAINAWFDGLANARKLHGAVHLGLAIDTSEGLMVPVIHDVATLTEAALRDKIQILKKGAVDRTLEPSMFKGATLMLSNFGTLAGRYATPIIVPPMVAILGVGKIYEQLKMGAKGVEAQRCLPLSLTVDHRCITGGEATRFLASLMKYLSQA